MPQYLQASKGLAEILHLDRADLAGCSLAGGQALASAAQPFLILRRAGPAQIAARDYRVALVAAERSPLNPRAPPAAA